jgi:hypothetical protein
MHVEEEESRHMQKNTVQENQHTQCGLAVLTLTNRAHLGSSLVVVVVVVRWGMHACDLRLGSHGYSEHSSRIYHSHPLAALQR